MPTCAASGGAAGQYRWYTVGTGGTAIAGETNATLSTYIISAATTLFVSINNGSCESARTAVNISYTTADALSIGSSPIILTSICLGSSFALTPNKTGNTNNFDLTWAASGANSGLSSSVSGSLGTALTITPTAVGTYTYTINGLETATGCIGIASVTATVINPNTGKSATASASPTPVCAGGATSLRVVVSTPGNATIGAGGSNSSTYPNPFYTNFGHSKNQYLVLASELTAVGIAPGNINSLAFNISSGTTNLTNFSVQMGNSMAANLSMLDITTTLTSVYSTTTLTPIIGLNVLTFSTPFNWDGISNVLIQTCFGNPNTTVVNSTATVDNTGFISCAHWNASATTTAAVTCSQTTSTTTYSIRPRFTFFTANMARTPTVFSWSDGTTIVGTTNPLSVSPPLVPTTYTVTATVNGCPMSASVAPTVIPNRTVAAASSAPTVCINTAITNITHTTTNVTGIASSAGLPAGVFVAYSSNTITISGTPSASGVFNYTITPIGCGTVTATGTITVTNRTVAAASSAPTVCINTAITNITHTTTNVTGITSSAGLPAGVTANYASNIITISGTPTASGIFNYTITPIGCGTVTATGIITVNPNRTVAAASSAPIVCFGNPIPSITHTSANVTGIASSTGLPAGVTANYASNTITISGTPTASGTFNYIITPIGCSTATATGSITVNPGATTASVQTATGATLVAGDLLWSGNTSNVWGLNTNWYLFNGTAFVVATGLPTTTTRVFILPSNTPGICISSTNNATIIASGIANHVFIGLGAIMAISAGQTLEVNGNWTNNGTFSPNPTAIVRFVGTAAQSIGGSSASIFTNLTVNKTGTLILNTPVSVSSTLTMSAGNIATTAANLLTIGTSTAAPGSIAWADGTVVGPIRRFFSGTSSPTQESGIFPLGLSGLNRYAQINYTSGLMSGGTITAEYKAGVPSINNSGLPITVNGQLIQKYEDEGYWDIAPSGGDLNTATYSLVLRGNTLSTVSSVANMAALRIIKSTGLHTSWDMGGIGVHAAPVGTTTDFTISNTGMVGFSWFNIGSDNSNPLPVTLLNFTANCDNKSNVNLKWTTASEQNSDKFIVKRSSDLVRWESLAEVRAAGNSNAKISYATMDKNPLAKISYYKLVQIDHNGTENVYTPISVVCADYNQSNSMVVFPNPAKGDFTVEINSKTDILQTTLTITDVVGKLVSSRPIKIKSGKNQFYFTDLHLPNGTYFVHVISSQNRIIPVKLVVD